MGGRRPFCQYRLRTSFIRAFSWWMNHSTHRLRSRLALDRPASATWNWEDGELRDSQRYVIFAFMVAKSSIWGTVDSFPKNRPTSADNPCTTTSCRRSGSRIGPRYWDLKVEAPFLVGYTKRREPPSGDSSQRRSTRKDGRVGQKTSRYSCADGGGRYRSRTEIWTLCGGTMGMGVWESCRCNGPRKSW